MTLAGIAHAKYPDRLTEVGYNVKRLCAERLIKMTALSDLTGIPRSTLSRLYYSDGVAVNKVRKIADAFDVDLYELFLPREHL